MSIRLAVAAVLAIIVSFAIPYSYYHVRGYHEPKNAWKCVWVEPVDPADKRACAAIPDEWLGQQFARCMVKLGYTRKCPDEVKP